MPFYIKHVSTFEYQVVLIEAGSEAEAEDKAGYDLGSFSDNVVFHEEIFGPFTTSAEAVESKWAYTE